MWFIYTFWEFANEWESGNGIDIYTHGQGIPLGGPPSEGMTSPLMKGGALLRYVLTTICAKGGQRLCMLLIAASLFRELKALLVSTSTTASVWSSSCMSVIARTPASQPLM